MSELVLSRSQYLEFEKLALGVFDPLNGFMNEDEFNAVVTGLRLPDGAPFTLPVFLDVSEDDAVRFRGRPHVTLVFAGHEVGRLELDSIYCCDKEKVAASVFGTADPTHPGVGFFYRGGNRFLGGSVTLTDRVGVDVTESELTPAETRTEFARRGWNSIVGFQTRNVPHRAHEYLQRVALEIADGLLVQPLIGRRKVGDYTPDAVMTGYRALIGPILPANRVLLSVLTTNMRYAGPREAIFHAIIRRNYGCTHFIVGRDHAGVGNYYGMYEAHEMARRFDGELGIEIMRLSGPYYCCVCGGIVTERSCPHQDTSPDEVFQISGTDIRAHLASGAPPDYRLIRREVHDALNGVPLFTKEDE